MSTLHTIIGCLGAGFAAIGLTWTCDQMHQHHRARRNWKARP